jgi:sRNA-binding regulator protein Hfq
MPSDQKPRDFSKRQRGTRPPGRVQRPSRNRLSELLDMGIPRRLAQQVAGGQRELNEVLQEMARQERADKLVEAHGIPRSLAVQVVLGQADLDAFLAKRRRHQYRDEVGGRSVFAQAVDSDEPFCFALLGRAQRTLQVLEAGRFELRVQGPDDSEPQTIHKLTVKMVYRAEDRKLVRKAISQDKAYRGVVAEPIWRIQDRYHCPDKVLFPWLEAATKVSLVTVEGDRIQGTVAWFSRYEIAMTVRGDAEVVVMRHALVDARAD